ncbi:hypothetical protein Tco_0831158, partial [Tanacetum coccineum]
AITGVCIMIGVVAVVGVVLVVAAIVVVSGGPVNGKTSTIETSSVECTI